MSERKEGYDAGGEAPPAGGFEEWCIVELMGHQVYAGKVTEQVIGGYQFLRVDVPAVPAGSGGAAPRPGFTKYLARRAVFALTPTTETLCREAAEGLRKVPVAPEKLPPSVWEEAGGHLQRELDKE